MMNRLCKKGWHKYRGRYHQEPPELDKLGTFKTTHAGMIDFINRMTKETYVHDICERCGDIVQQED